MSPIDGKKFKIIADKYGEEESELPFSDGNKDPNLFTVLNALNTFNPKYEHKDKNDEDWMVEEGILKENKLFFHENMRKNIGQKLYQALFPKSIQDTLNEKLGEAGSEQYLHIQIQYDANTIKKSKLSLYPWQLVNNRQEFLAKRQVIFSYLIAHRNSLPTGKRKVNQIKCLLILSTASENENQQLKKKESIIRNGLSQAQQENQASLLNWCEGERPTYKKLSAYLTDNLNKKEKLPDIIHFDGHGVFKKECTNPSCSHANTNEEIQSPNQNECKFCKAPLGEPKGFLLFEDDEGKPDYINAEKFANLVSISKPALVVITACKSALAHQSESVFNGIAQSVLREVPAVVATPFTISENSTTNFVEHFYRVLGAQQSLLKAVKFASEQMHFDNDEWWYRPVIFLRDDGDEDGYLFDFEDIYQPRCTPLASDVEEISYLNKLFDDSEKWIRFLENSLQYKKHLEEFNLKLKELHDAVRNNPARDTKSLLENTISTKDIFKKHKSLRLLILGAPGSGKTTIILTILKKLKEYLKESNNQNLQKPVPVYLHLSSWVDKHENFDVWLVDKLYQQYKIPKKYGKKIYNKRLILLLDGFDEINERYRGDCVEKLNHFIQNNSLIEIVVCSRLQEYQNIFGCDLLKQEERKICDESKKLKLENAYFIQPLTVE